MIDSLKKFIAENNYLIKIEDRGDSLCFQWPNGPNGLVDRIYRREGRSILIKDSEGFEERLKLKSFMFKPLLVADVFKVCLKIGYVVSLVSYPDSPIKLFKLRRSEADKQEFLCALLLEYVKDISKFDEFFHIAADLDLENEFLFLKERILHE